MLDIFEKQREYFLSGATLDVDERIANLRKLKSSILEHQQDIFDAFMQDLNKCEFDVISTEIGMVMDELSFMIKNTRRLARPKRVATSLINAPSRGYLLHEPYGNVLVVAPWNYPFQLTILPVVSALAAGNVVIVKPSRSTPTVSKVIAEILNIFDQKLVYTVTSNSDEVEQLFDLPFDFIFYTGSTSVAKDLMSRQAKYLTPMVLELGGKSPCIINYDADIEKTAKRIVWGKFLNGGQTCVAPDYFLVHNAVKEKLLPRILHYIEEYFYVDGKLTEDFCRVVNQRHVDRLLSYIEENKLIRGGRVFDGVLEPTVLDNVTFDDKVMQDEIFGAIMPIINFSNLCDVVERLKRQPKPLALYYFGKNTQDRDYVLENVSSGGACVNDVIMHLTEQKLPFGGVGKSGMGSYHGKKSFEVFSHVKSVLSKSTKTELNLKYPPYTSKKLRLLRMFFGVKK